MWIRECLFTILACLLACPAPTCKLAKTQRYLGSQGRKKHIHPQPGNHNRVQGRAMVRLVHWRLPTEYNAPLGGVIVGFAKRTTPRHQTFQCFRLNRRAHENRQFLPTVAPSAEPPVSNILFCLLLIPVPMGLAMRIDNADGAAYDSFCRKFRRAVVSQSIYSTCTISTCMPHEVMLGIFY